MTRESADDLFTQRRNYGRLAKQLAKRLEEEQQLLQLALYELSAKTGERERERFVREWLNLHRKLDMQGVPIEHP